MSTMAENVIAAGAENRPPMLERSQCDSWQSRMLLYIRGKEHGIHLLDSFKMVHFSLERLKSHQLQTYLLQHEKELLMISHLKRRYMKPMT
ncbi:hypothetical protein Tco_1478249 [Tanacetum coccineum]